MSCYSFNVICCFEEYIEERRVDKIKLGDRVRVYRKHIKQHTINN